VGAHPREGGAKGLRLRPFCSLSGRTPLALDHLLKIKDARYHMAAVYVTLIPQRR